MLGAEANLRIKLGILHAAIYGYALERYSGDLYFRYRGRNLEILPDEMHIEVVATEEPYPGKPTNAVLRSLTDAWPGIDVWLESINTVLLVGYQDGRIYRARIRDKLPPHMAEGRQESSVAQ
jgi:hypothetical protein